jgi:hypothetical protein
VELIQRNIAETRNVERQPAFTSLQFDDSNNDVIMNDSALLADENESEANEEEIELIQTIADYRPVEKSAPVVILNETNQGVVLNDSALSENNTTRENDEVESIQVKNVGSRESLPTEKAPVDLMPAYPSEALALNDSNSDVVILNDSL